MSNDGTKTKVSRFARAVASLSPIEREILRLRAAEGLSDQEIALRLGLSAERVERTLEAALLKLDRRLEPANRRWWKFW